MKNIKKRKFISNLVKGFGTTSIGITINSYVESDNDILKKFMKISENLTGDHELDLELGKKYFEHLVMANKQNKRKIIELYAYNQNQIPETRRDLKKLSKEILISWFTGIVKVNGISRLVTYTGSHTWTKLKGMKPQGFCGGKFGYWSKKPKLT